ncbi:kinase-like domain-containing protein [Baffinella frigidus]|nr:kinase-like domain-containing protein [Cryptophyta sp. CCMP2293]
MNGERPHRATRHSFNALSGEWKKAEVHVVWEARPFDEGAMRTAHRMWEVDAAGGRTPWVAKRNKTREPDRAVCWEDAKMASVAAVYGEAFNRKASRAGMKLNVAFLPSYALEVNDSREVFAIEPLLSGDFQKHNNNDGATIGRRTTPQAFSHFTWEESNHSVLVCDIQGVRDYWTDAQVHSTDGKGHGLGNCGIQGIRRFAETHVCNEICKQLGLPRMDAGAPAGGSRPGGARQPAKGASTVLAEDLARGERARACRGDEALAREMQRGQEQQHRR